MVWKLPKLDRAEADSTRQVWIYWIAGAAMVIAVAAAWRFLPLTRLIDAFAGWMAGLGTIGLVAFILIYAGTALAMGPAWSLSVAAGLAFGFWAIPLVLAAAVTAAAAGFVLARHIGRDKVISYIRQKPRIDAIDQAVRTHGFKAVLLLRLSPAVPFGAKSYLLGLTAVPSWAYLSGTLVGIIPGSTFYVYLGSLGHVAIRGGPSDRVEWGLLVLGLLATGAALVIISREARRRLRAMGL